MTNSHYPLGAFQTFFISRETSRSPFISELIRFCRNMAELQGCESGSGSISFSYGKRLLINGRNTSLDTIRPDNFVEIVDYDPLKNIMVTIGTIDPCNEAPVHWIVQHARADIHAMVILYNRAIVEQLSRDLPLTKIQDITGSLDGVKDVLRLLQESSIIIIRNQGILCVGFDLKEIQDSIQEKIH